jgi:hypothetical protein
MTNHETYQILLSADRWVLASTDQKEEPKVYRVPNDIVVQVRHLADDEFKSPSDDKWSFGANGLCEPVSFLFRRGNDWVRFQMSPLTARIENQQSFIR